jgi:hypothetical protein
MRRILFCAIAATIGLTAAADAQRKPQIILYKEDNYRGEELIVDGPVDRIKTLHFDDRVSSVHVLSGTWLLCSDDVYRGTCITLRQDEPKLSRLDFDDKLSSLRPVGNDRRDDRRDRRDR